MLASDLALMDYDRKLRTLQNGLKFQIKTRIIGTFPKRGCCYFCCFVLGSLNLAALTDSIMHNIVNSMCSRLLLQLHRIS